MERDLTLLATDFTRSGDQYFLILDQKNDSKLIGWGNNGAHMRPEVVEWLKANTPSYSITGGGTTGQSIMLLFKGTRDPALFKMFWL